MRHSRLLLLGALLLAGFPLLSYSVVETLSCGAQLERIVPLDPLALVSFAMLQPPPPPPPPSPPPPGGDTGGQGDQGNGNQGNNDKDNDGVSDDKDECPDTPPDTAS